jgi:PAS domain S-box-containing protein
MITSVMSIRYGALAVLLAALYFVAAKLSLLMAIPPGYATAIWPPAGITLAALLVFGPRIWPGVWLGAALVNATVEYSWAAAALIATGNTLEALAGAYFIRRDMGIPRRFERGADVANFLALCAASATIAASVGTFALSFGRPMASADVAYNWWTWWQGDACGMIIVTPLILSFMRRNVIPWTRMRIAEVAVFAVLLAGLTQFVFGRAIFDPLPLAVPFVVLPLIVWAAFRFDQREVCIAIAATAVIAVYHTLAGRGPFAAGSANESLLALLLFVSVEVFMGLVLSAVMREREVALAELGHKHNELQERFRLMVNTVVDYAIYMLDAQGRVVSWNTGAQKIKGYTAEEIAGKHYSVFFLPEDVASGKPQRLLETARNEGRIVDEGWRLRKDGNRFWADAVITAVRDASGRLIGYGKVTRDLTSKKVTESQLLGAKIDAERASDAKSEFLAKMSHELRTPLNSLLILSKMLAENTPGNLTEKQVKYATTIHEAGTDLLGLINDVLDLAKIESGAPFALHFAPLSFDDLRGALERTFRQMAQDKDLEFKISVAPDLPPAFNTDAQRLRQVLNNLLSNALKFTPEGSVTLQMSPASPGKVAFVVSDTGIGIPSDKREFVFEAFGQVDMGTTRRYNGTGLGLSISRELSRLLGGDIRLNASSEETGTVFTLVLPLEQSAATAAAGAAPA